MNRSLEYNSPIISDSGARNMLKDVDLVEGGKIDYLVIYPPCDDKISGKLVFPKSEHPLVSIIIPTYNRPQMLRNALLSIRTLHKDKVEILVCDDKSLDENKRKNKEICKKTSDELGIEIIYLENTRTKGVSGARNSAIDKSSGQWLLFLDDDDEFTENYVDYVLDYVVDHSDLDIMWSNVIISKKINGKVVKVKKYFTPKNTDELYRDFISIGLGYGVVIKKKSLLECGLFNEELCVAEDTDLFLSFIRLQKSINNLFCFGVVLHEHEYEKLSRTYDYHAKNHIFKNLYEKNYRYLKPYKLLYISFASWIINVYKQTGMTKEAILFCIEFWIRNINSRLVNKQFLYEIKHLRWG